MSQEIFELEFQMWEQEMKRILPSEFQQIQKELDCKKTRSSRSPSSSSRSPQLFSRSPSSSSRTPSSSSRSPSSSSRSSSSYEFLRREPSHDSYSSRNSSRSKENHDISSSTSRYSSVEVQSWRAGCVSYVNLFPLTRQKSSHFDSSILTPYCNKNVKEKNIERKERQEFLMKTNE
ncbi:hypothetical protein V6Z12_D06G126600 [Gossypium hirsutum]